MVYVSPTEAHVIRKRFLSATDGALLKRSMSFHWHSSSDLLSQSNVFNSPFRRGVGIFRFCNEELDSGPPLRDVRNDGKAGHVSGFC